MRTELRRLMTKDNKSAETKVKTNIRKTMEGNFEATADIRLPDA
jgi:hypothetical protein